MSKHVKYVPKHRAAPTRATPAEASKKAVRTGVVLSSVAVAATGVAVAGGMAGSGATVTTAAADVEQDAVQPAAEVQVPERAPAISRSDRRDAADPDKQAALSTEGRAMTVSEDSSDDDPRAIARALLPQFGFSADQFSCLDSLYVSESDWRIDADNPTSSAYGIPQALTALHDLPADYMTSAEAQIRWGLDYIRDTYGSPCSAWSFKQANNWY